MSGPSLQELQTVAIEAACLGGKRTLAYFNAGVAVEIKTDNTPVTPADREAEAVIRKHIAEYFPYHTVLGEEGGIQAGDSDYRWIIDPIDGTKTFIHGVPLYGVLIGIEVKGVPSVGVVYLPALDELVTAALGCGCRWNGRPCRVSNVAKLEDATLLVSSVSMAMERSDAYERLARQTKLQRTWGDCYGYVLVATGRAEIMLDPRMKAWDCAPMLPILSEAGGSFTNWKGEATIWGGDSVATNAALHKPVLSVLQSEKRR